jgi:hypothetical protein
MHVNFFLSHIVSSFYRIGVKTWQFESLFTWNDDWLKSSHIFISKALSRLHFKKDWVLSRNKHDCRILTENNFFTPQCIGLCINFFWGSKIWRI